MILKPSPNARVVAALLALLILLPFYLWERNTGLLITGGSTSIAGGALSISSDASLGRARQVAPPGAVLTVGGDADRVVVTGSFSMNAGGSVLGGLMREIEIPDSHHHVMIDQPLALVAALRTLLATWPA